MIKLIAKGLIAFAAVSALAFAPTSIVSAAAGSGTASLALSSASNSHLINSTFTITVKETSSEPVAAIEADLAYDASKLQCLSVDGSSSAFATAYQNSCANGKITIARGVQGTPVSGTQTVAVINFKALISSGSTQITALGTSEIDNATVTNVCDSTCASGAVLSTQSFSAPATTQPSNPTATAPTTSAPANGSSSSNKSSSSKSSSSSKKAVLGEDKSTPTQKTDAPKQPASSDKKETKQPEAKKSSVVPKILLGLGIFALAAAAAQAMQRRKTQPIVKRVGTPSAVAPAGANKKAATKRSVAKKPSRK